MKPKKTKFRLGKKTVAQLTNSNISKINAGGVGTTLNTLVTLVSLFEQTCKCTFPPKCTSDNNANNIM
jgi:hypothetical protein